MLRSAPLSQKVDWPGSGPYGAETWDSAFRLADSRPGYAAALFR